MLIPLLGFYLAISLCLEENLGLTQEVFGSLDYALLTLMTVSLYLGSRWVIGLPASSYFKLYTMLIGLVTLATGPSCFVFSVCTASKKPTGPNYCRCLFSLIATSVPRYWILNTKNGTSVYFICF